MVGYTFNTNPSLQDLEDIANWMQEGSKTGNLGSISKAWTRKELITLNEKDVKIGFCAFDTETEIGKINVIEIEECQRDQGLGKFLIEFVLEIMARKNMTRVEVFVPDKEYKSFWKKLGFKIKKDFGDSRLEIYKNINC